MEKDYNKTLNLPKTDYPMRGNLPAAEPVAQKKWEEAEIYKKLIDTRRGICNL